jgi:Pyridoxamine 5'-phosphate oxidase
LISEDALTEGDFRWILVGACRCESGDVRVGWDKEWDKGSKLNWLPSRPARNGGRYRMSEKDQTRGRGEVGRPYMPGYGIRPDGEGLLPWSFVDERMANARNYWVATTRPDGRPHATPVSGVWIDGSFYFGTGPGSRKARNLAKNQHLVVHLESGDEVVILEGVAEEVADPASLDGASARSTG